MPAPLLPSAVTDTVADASYADALLLDADDRIVWARGPRARTSQREAEPLMGTPILDLLADGEHERGSALLGAARTTGALLVDTVRLRDGRVVEVALHDLPQLGLLVESWDVTARDARERDLRERSLHDPLTGVANRVLLLDRLEWALASRRGRPARVGVLFVDIDAFKKVNDRWGHAVGDAVLVEVASRIDDVLRPADTVGRVGGDEFAVVCDDVTDVGDLRRIGERVCVALQQPARVLGVDLPLRASIGGAVCLDGSASATDLLGAADAAMYDVKSSGGSGLQVRVLADELEARQA